MGISMMLSHPQPVVHRPIGYDFASWILWLRPYKNKRVPLWLGRAAQALFYSELSGIHGELATYIHDMSCLKPFTVSNLMGGRKIGDMQMLSPDRLLRLRVTSMHPHMTAIIHNGILPSLKQNGLCLHHQALRIVGIDYGAGRSNFTTIEQLSASLPNETRIRLCFLSPTSFKRTGDDTGYYDPYPHAELVFGSLFQKWRDATPYRLSRQLNRSISEMIELKSADIREHTIRFARGQKGVVPCFTGTATYVIHEPESHLRRQLQLLAKFARYSGVGVQTTVGLGQADVIS